MSNKPSPELVTASKIMSAANFDPQTGCSDAFRYVVGQVESLSAGTDLEKASQDIAGYLSEEFKIVLGRPVDAKKVQAVLEEHFAPR